MLGQERFSSFGIKRCATAAVRYFIICSIVEQPASFGLVNATPLFEKERHSAGGALIANCPDPVAFNRAESWSAFTAGDHPVDAGQVERSEIFEEWFY